MSNKTLKHNKTIKEHILKQVLESGEYPYIYSVLQFVSMMIMVLNYLLVILESS